MGAEKDHEEEDGSSSMEVDQEDQEEEELEESVPINTAPQENENDNNDGGFTFSKSWAIDKAHVPIYTGGKISPLYLKNSSDDVLSCIILPVDGDLVVVDAQRGTKLGSVRERTDTNEDDEDDEGLDRDAITAYALSSSNSLVTCSRNHLMQQYEIKLVQDDDDNNNDTVQVTLQKKWGRSGHSLPVTEMEFHTSGTFVATASIDGTCRIFDARPGHVTHIYRPIAGGESGRHGVSSIAWMKDTTHLVIAIGRDDGSIAIHDLRDQDMKRVVVTRE
ncbi:transducin beta-like 3 (Partial), partial [Seminavis robusta]|eukprot:Sro2695_g334900.1 transducin beta-like 3 (275) ;mRNA; f:11591-12415